MWSHLPRTVLALATFASLTVHVSMPTYAAGATAAPPALELVDMPPEFAGAVASATDLFDQAGFDLPPLRYVFHGDTRAPCAGRTGLHHRIEGVNVVEICTAESSSVMSVMVLHETAHAWIDHALTDERKAAFQRLPRVDVLARLRRCLMARQRHRAGS